MNAEGIDVSKGKSMVTILRPFGEIVSSPREIRHTSDQIDDLVRKIRSLEGDTRIVMEYTGRYHEPMAHWLSDAGLFVSSMSISARNGVAVRDTPSSPINRPKSITQFAISFRFFQKTR